jgi:hypothetical protein
MVVPVTSAHGRNTISRRLANALVGKNVEFREEFDHLNVGTSNSDQGDQRIVLFAEDDILPFFSDHYVVATSSGVLHQCPTATVNGRVVTETGVDFKATNGGLTGLGWVTYVENSSGEWSIVAGADSEGVLDPATLVMLNGNNVNGDPVPVLIDRPILMGTDAVRIATNLVPTGSSAANGGVAPPEPRLDCPENIKICP